MINIQIDGQFLFGTAAVVIALTGLLAQWRQGHKTDAVSEQVAEASRAGLQATADVKKEVVTGNEQTLGQLGMRTETHRVEKVPHADRTAQEQRHMDADPLSKEEAT